jgi:hypothetical protein
LLLYVDVTKRELPGLLQYQCLHDPPLACGIGA